VKSQKIGSSRVLRRLTNDVNLSEVPHIEGQYEVLGADALSLIGDAPKSFVVFPTERPYARAFIAKGPRKHGPRECVTEYLIACIGRELPLRVAEGSLAILPGGSKVEPDIRFLSRYFLRPELGEGLVHGVELVAERFDLDVDTMLSEIPRGKEVDFYTMDLIEEVLRKTGRHPVEAKALLDGFIRMLAFDSLVGANDRHPRNWGVIRSAIDASRPLLYAPVFDTARGLFWNYSDKQLESEAGPGRLDSFIERYADKSSPQIGVPGQRRPNHFDLLRYLLERPNAHSLRPAVSSVIEPFDPERCARLLHTKFGRLFSRRRLELVDALLRFRHARLKSILRIRPIRAPRT
jgi:hypothetical protein